METPAPYHAVPAIKLRPCPFCHQHMTGTSRRELVHEKTGQTYTKWGYMCPHCDVWLFSRAPLKLVGPMDHFQQIETSEEDEIPAVTNVVDYAAQYPLRNAVELRVACQFCRNPMGSVYRGEETNDRTGQHYIKTRYYCRHCDYWHSIKVPRKLAETVSRDQPEPVLAV